MSKLTLSAPRARLLASAAALSLPLALAACGDSSKIPAEQQFGSNPTLPAPNASLIPTIQVADAKGWPEGGKPTPAAGMTVQAYATGLQHPRTVRMLPNGDAIVAESDAPPKPDDGKGVKGFFMHMFMKKAGSNSPSANRITLLRDKDGDGVAETRSVLLSGLNSPFGVVLSGETLYVANTDAVWAYPYKEGDTTISAQGRKVADLPAGTINHHWTKDITASPDGTKLYVTVGSNSNVAENGLDAEKDRAAVLEIDPATGKSRVFASGLRNPNGITYNPVTKELWVAVNERDEIGSDLVPDYMTSIRDGEFFGWPFSYYGNHVDTRVKEQRPDLVAKAKMPDYALGTHTASLGLVFNTGEAFPPDYKNGAFVGQHGSWNRKPPSGYKVIFVPFVDGKPSGQPRDVLTGFLNDKGEAQGRPVGVAIDKAGALLVADDVGGAIWRVTPSAKVGMN